jgi:hypothetical protein
MGDRFKPESVIGMGQNMHHSVNDKPPPNSYPYSFLLT